MEEEGAVTEAEVVSVAGVASTTTCMEASMDTCHSLLKILLLSQAPQKDPRLMLPRVPKLCVRVCPTAAFTVGADTKEEGTLILRLHLNLNLCLHNHLNHKENAANRLLTTPVSVVDHLHTLDQVRTAASASTVSSRKIAKHELVDARDVAVTRENTTTNLPTPTERRIPQDLIPATKTHLEDHAVAEETEKSIVQPARTAETAIIVVAAADPRTTVPLTTISLAPRAAATETAREKKNAQTATEATVTANALAGTAQPLPMVPLTIILLAAHVAKSQHLPPTTKVSRSRALAQAPSPSLHPPALATLATRTEPTDDLLLPLSPYPKTMLLALLQTHMLKNAKLASKSVWLKNSRDVKAPP